jgi:Flp pilus assembly protein TadD
MPELVDPILDMGKVDFREGQWDEAIGWYKRAIDVEPTRPDPYLMLGEAYFEKGELAEARTWYEKTLMVASDRSRSPSLNYTYIASLRAGVCALGLGDPEGAEQHLRRASESEPTLWRPLYRLACAEARQGDLEGALRALQAAAAQGFTNVSALQRDACLRPLVAEPGFQAFVRTLAGRAQH